MNGQKKTQIDVRVLDKAFWLNINSRKHPPPINTWPLSNKTFLPHDHILEHNIDIIPADVKPGTSPRVYSPLNESCPPGYMHIKSAKGQAELKCPTSQSVLF